MDLHGSLAPVTLEASPRIAPRSLWDDPNLTTNFGVSTPGVPKSIYLGIDLAGSEAGVTSIEFSIARHAVRYGWDPDRRLRADPAHHDHSR